MMKNFEDMFSHFDTNMTDGHCMMAYVMLMHSITQQKNFLKMLYARSCSRHEYMQ